MDHKNDEAMARARTQKPSGYETLARQVDARLNLRLLAAQGIDSCNALARRKAFTAITEWLGEPDKQKSVFWLHGPQGCGKTVIAKYLTVLADDHESLTSSYTFFKCDQAQLQTTFVCQIITDLGIYLGDDFAGPAKAKTDQAIDQCGSVASFIAEKLEKQMSLILIPAWAALAERSKKPLFVILDSVDKMEDYALRALCMFIKHAIENLPILFLLTGRTGRNGKSNHYNHAITTGACGKWVTAMELSRWDPGASDELPTPVPTKAAFSDTELEVPPAGSPMGPPHRSMTM